MVNKKDTLLSIENLTVHYGAAQAHLSLYRAAA